MSILPVTIDKALGSGSHLSIQNFRSIKRYTQENFYRNLLNFTCKIGRKINKVTIGEDRI